MMKIIKSLLLLGTLAWLTGCAQTTVRHHQDFQEVAKNIESVVIIPADVDIELIVFDGDNEKLVDKEKTIQAEIHALAKVKLEAENLKVIDFDFKKEAENDEEFAYALTQAREAWDISKEDMYKKGVVGEKDKANFQTNLGSVLNIIAEKTGAESVLFMHFSSFEKSKGVIAKDVTSSILIGVLTLGAVIPIQATEGSFIDIALVETTAGKIIWANRKVGASSDSSAAQFALKELPDLVWETEVVAEEQASALAKEASTAQVESAPQKN
ncbi:MAG: hypothetical protein ACI8SK_001503 [Shewanella sp.]|jgi:hypothetical protein